MDLINNSPIKLTIHVKDYSFSGSRTNPYVEPSTTNRRPLILGVVAGLCGLVTIGLLLTHPTFALRVVNVDSVSRIDRSSVIEAVQGTLNHRLFFILPGNNFFTANLEDVSDVLKARFPVAQVVITKKFPGSLNIQIIEKQAVLVFDNGKSYQALDADGGLVTLLGKITSVNTLAPLVSTSTLSGTTSTSAYQTVLVTAHDKYHIPNRNDFSKEWHTLPILLNDRLIATSTSENVPSSIIEAVLAWNTFFQQILIITPAYFRILTDDWSQAEIKTKDGFYINVNLIDNRDAQYASLSTLFKQHGGERKNWQYVELRYPGKVYWK